LETEELLITNVLFTGAVHENLTVFFGKLDTLDGDRNPFASGRGKSQFMNTSLLLPVNGLPTVPLATLGAGALLMVDGLPLAQFMVLNATDTVDTVGISELFADGALVLGSVNVPLPIAGNLGIHTFTAGWSSKTFTSLGQDARLIIQNVPLQQTEGSWLAWWSGAQYLVQDERDPMKGWGLFGRAGAADGEVNPIEYFFNAGIGGQSPLRGRENDKFGIGWFYNRYSDELGPIANALLDLREYSTGVELFYNYAATTYVKITPDLQIIEPGSNRANTALVVGMRLEMDF
jgi:porin